MTVNLVEAWERLKQDQPGIRIRNAASALGVSELELLSTRIGLDAVLLKGSAQEILARIPSLGRVMALTRNEHCVIECKGVYQNPLLDKAHAGVFVGEDIDLRMFFQFWHYALAVTEQSEHGIRKSLQFFNQYGEAVHKIYLLAESETAGYDEILAAYGTDGTVDVPALEREPPAEEAIPDALIDVESFRHEWISLRDTHEFLPLLHKYGLTRIQALRLAPVGGYALQVPVGTATEIIRLAAASGVPIMLFAGNKGMLQIYSGEVHKIVDHGEWFNILDPKLNLHLRPSGIDQCWIVRKPTNDGIITGIECYDSQGELVLQIFGKRKPGVPELEAWRNIVEQFEL